MGKEGRDAAYLQDDAWYDENGIELMKNLRVRGVDAEAHTVALGDDRELTYEKLLLATGGHAWRLPIAGADLGDVYTLRTIEDSDAIRQAAGNGKHALVLGGSFIGSEVAASLTQIGLDVTMVFPKSRLLQRVVPEAFSDFLHAKFEGQGVRILNGTTPERLESDGAVDRVLLSSGETLQVDLVVMGVGIRLNTALAEDAGLELTERGEVVVDEYLRTSDPDIYAAG